MSKQERFKMAFDYLKSKGLIHKQKDVAERMGSTEPNVSAALKGAEKVLTEKFLSRFNKAFDNIFNIDWLLKEEGEMMRNNYTNNVNVADNASVRNVIGNINGHSINVDAPKAESVKIIKPDGTVETYTSNHSLQELLDLKEQLHAMMVELESKKREISSLEKIIAAKDETISILKNEHNKK